MWQNWAKLLSVPKGFGKFYPKGSAAKAGGRAKGGGGGGSGGSGGGSGGPNKENWEHILGATVTTSAAGLLYFALKPSSGEK